MTLSLKVISALILALIILGAYSYHLMGKTKALETKLELNEKTLALLRLSLSSQYQELQTREAELEAVKLERKERDKAYEEVKTNDSESCSWAAVTIPGPILDFLCQNP
jgi:Tfp pilus assembly protein PilO